METWIGEESTCKIQSQTPSIMHLAVVKGAAALNPVCGGPWSSPVPLWRGICPLRTWLCEEPRRTALNPPHTAADPVPKSVTRTSQPGLRGAGKHTQYEPQVSSFLPFPSLRTLMHSNMLRTEYPQSPQLQRLGREEQSKTEGMFRPTQVCEGGDKTPKPDSSRALPPYRRGTNCNGSKII